MNLGKNKDLIINEREELIKRYSQRKGPGDELYSIFNEFQLASLQEKERKLIRLFKSEGYTDLSKLRLFDIGCGYGVDLLQFIRMGFNPANLTGLELVKERMTAAKSILPSSTSVLLGDAGAVEIKEESFDFVYQSTVFSSILNTDYKKVIAEKMWIHVKPGGGIIWYDFIYNNPKNKDVRGVKLKEIGQLFPKGIIKYWKLTLAPPLGRKASSLNPKFYHLLNVFPFFRTHVLCFIRKN